MIKVTEIFRHPVKSHGREALSSVHLTAGETMPWDRVWAVAHEASKFDDKNPAWVNCNNFTRVAKAPELAAIDVVVDEARETLTFTHPKCPSLTINPDLPDDGNKLIQWVAPLMPTDRAQADRVVRVPGRGLTDSPEPTVSINSHASLRAISDKVGHPISPLRWRGNIWIDGLEPWIEFDWVGCELQVGGTRLQVIEQIERCTATMANPETGARDIDTLDLLKNHWGHKNFGVQTRVIKSGEIKAGDKVVLL